MHDEDGKCSGFYGVGLLNDGSYRSGTQGRRLEDVGASTAKGCDGCYDDESNENGVALIKTRLLRKGLEQ